LSDTRLKAYGGWTWKRQKLRGASRSELSRATSELIDQVERDGKTFAISRHGRLVALVVPLPERLQLHFDETAVPNPVEDVVGEVELTDAQRDLLVDSRPT